MKTAAIFVSLFLYGISLANPVFYFIESGASGHTSPYIYQGYNVLFTGWLRIFVAQFGWFANPPYYLSLSLVALQQWRIAIAVSTISLFIGITNTIWLFFQTIRDNTGSFTLHHLERGYYFWVVALSVPLIYSLSRFRYSKPR